MKSRLLIDLDEELLGLQNVSTTFGGVVLKQMVDNVFPRDCSVLHAVGSSDHKQCTVYRPAATALKSTWTVARKNSIKLYYLHEGSILGLTAA